jgi:predicted nucleotidyltransferase
MAPSPALDEMLERLVGRLRDAAGDNLLGVALYGGLVKGRYTPGISDVNLLVVLADARLPALLALAPVLTGALRDASVIPFLTTPRDLRDSTTLFPVKILDIQTSHRVLWGDPHLAGLTIDAAALRLRTLQEIKNLEMRLRLRLVERGAEPGALWRGLVSSLPKVAVTLESVLRFRGIAVPADRPTLLRRAAAELGVPEERIGHLADLHRVDQRPEDGAVRRLYGEYLDLLAELGARAGEAAP